MSSIFFQGGAKNILRVASPPLRPPWLRAWSDVTLNGYRTFLFLYNFKVNSGSVRFTCLAAQTLAEKQSSVKVFFITQIDYRPRAWNSKWGPNEDLKKKQGRITTIQELQYDADAKKAVPETY